MDGRPLYPIPPPRGGYLPHMAHLQQERPSRESMDVIDARDARTHKNKRSQSTREPYYERRILEEDRKIRDEIRRRKSCAQYSQDRPGGRPEPRPKKPIAAPRSKEYTVSEEDIEKTYTGLDREIAEEFICAVMEPSSRHHLQQLSDDDQSSYR